MDIAFISHRIQRSCCSYSFCISATAGFLLYEDGGRRGRGHMHMKSCTLYLPDVASYNGVLCCIYMRVEDKRAKLPL